MFWFPLFFISFFTPFMNYFLYLNNFPFQLFFLFPTFPLPYPLIFPLSVLFLSVIFYIFLQPLLSSCSFIFPFSSSLLVSFSFIYYSFDTFYIIFILSVYIYFRFLILFSYFFSYKKCNNGPRVTL